jgi:invasion protein IalB
VPTATLARTLAVLVLAAPALAQQQPKAPSQKQSPFATGAQPYSDVPGVPAATGQQQTELMSLPWMKVCTKGPDTDNKRVCVITKESLFENGGTTVQMFEPEGGQKFLRVTVPLGVQLSYGTRMLIDQNPPTQSPYNMCFPIGCASDYQVTDDLIAKMKKGQNIIVEAIDGQNTQISLPVPLNDFAKAYDGPPTDMKVFLEQQRKLLELQKRSQEERQKEAEETRKKLEGQTQAPPAALAPAQKK